MAFGERMRRACDTHAALQQIRSAAPATNRRSAAPNALPRTRIIRAESQRTCRSHRRPTCLNTRALPVDGLRAAGVATLPYRLAPVIGPEADPLRTRSPGPRQPGKGEPTIACGIFRVASIQTDRPRRCEEAYRSTAVRANRLTMAMQETEPAFERIGMRLLIFAGVTLVHLLGLAWVFAHAPERPSTTEPPPITVQLLAPPPTNATATPPLSADPAPRPAPRRLEKPIAAPKPDQPRQPKRAVRPVRKAEATKPPAVPRADELAVAASAVQEPAAEPAQPSDLADAPAPAAQTAEPRTASQAAAPPAARESETPARFDAAYLRNPAPRYPPLARRLGEQGRIILRVRVDSAGNPATIELFESSGSARLDAAARQTVAGWRFVPARRGGKPIESWVQVPIIFKLEN